MTIWIFHLTTWKATLLSSITVASFKLLSNFGLASLFLPTIESKKNSWILKKIEKGYLRVPISHWNIVGFHCRLIKKYISVCLTVVYRNFFAFGTFCSQLGKFFGGEISISATRFQLDWRLFFGNSAGNLYKHQEVPKLPDCVGLPWTHRDTSLKGLRSPLHSHSKRCKEGEGRTRANTPGSCFMAAWPRRGTNPVLPLQISEVRPGLFGFPHSRFLLQGSA